MSKFIKFINDVYIDPADIAYFCIQDDWPEKALTKSYRLGIYLKNNPNLISPVLETKAEFDEFCSKMGIDYGKEPL